MPAEGPYSEIFNDVVPFLAPLAIGVMAAVSEEVTFRLFGISLVTRYLKSTAVAVLVPAAICAFAHSNYPVFPVYERGIELTIAGAAFGVAFLRLGLVTCIVAHFVIDAVLWRCRCSPRGYARHLGGGRDGGPARSAVVGVEGQGKQAA